MCRSSRFAVATPAEIAAPRAGDELLPRPDVVMDRAFTVDAPPGAVWPWLVQLGKERAGWYLPRRLDRFLPRRFRAARAVDDRWQHPSVGDVVPDYGLHDDTFTVEQVTPPHALVYSTRRGRTGGTWSITLEPVGAGTRVALRLRLHPVRHVRLVRTVGGLFDLLTIAGMAAGLRERVAEAP